MHTRHKSLPRGYKTISCSTELSMKLTMLINARMPTITIYQHDKDNV